MGATERQPYYIEHDEYQEEQPKLRNEVIHLHPNELPSDPRRHSASSGNRTEMDNLSSFIIEKSINDLTRE